MRAHRFPTLLFVFVSAAAAWGGEWDAAAVDAAERGRPVAPEILSPRAGSHEPVRVSQTSRAVPLMWSTPQQPFAVDYYVVVWARYEDQAPERVVSTYANPPFRFETPQFGVTYAWRVTAVDSEDTANIAPSDWAFFAVEPAD